MNGGRRRRREGEKRGEEDQGGEEKKCPASQSLPVPVPLPLSCPPAVPSPFFLSSHPFCPQSLSSICPARPREMPKMQGVQERREGGGGRARGQESHCLTIHMPHVPVSTRHLGRSHPNCPTPPHPPRESKCWSSEGRGGRRRKR